MLGNQSLIFSHAKSLLDYPCGNWYLLPELLPKHRVVQVAEKLLIEVFALCVMRKMTECPTKNAWIKSVARPEAVISCMRLDQQACDNNIVEKLRELVFRKPKDAQVHILHSNVHSDLKEEVKHSVIHSVPCEHSPSESGDLMMLVVLTRAVNPTHLVHYEVQPGEEKVISYDSKRNLACQAPERNESSG